MSTKRIRQLENQIFKIKEQISELGPLRPGTLTKQYKEPSKKQGASYQLSYTHKMKSRTQYVRAEHVSIIKKELVQYKRYKILIERFIDLSINLSKEKIAEMKKQKR